MQSWYLEGKIHCYNADENWEAVNTNPPANSVHFFRRQLSARALKLIRVDGLCRRTTCRQF